MGWAWVFLHRRKWVGHGLFHSVEGGMGFGLYHRFKVGFSYSLYYLAMVLLVIAGDAIPESRYTVLTLVGFRQ